jgi:hypothetical protein
LFDLVYTKSKNRKKKQFAVIKFSPKEPIPAPEETSPYKLVPAAEETSLKEPYPPTND